MARGSGKRERKGGRPPSAPGAETGGPSATPEEDRALWAAVTATVRPLARRDTVPARGASESAPAKHKAEAARPAKRPAAARGAGPHAPSGAHAAERPAATPRPPPRLAPGETAGVDRRTAERLRRGKLPVEGRLDLHGMSREAAHGATVDFLLAAHGAGKRCVVVVTGKGRGILKDSVPHWLNLPPVRQHVLAFTPARPEHGGDGALYVLLKRRRDARP